jgi:hypothetical protein
MITVPSNPIPPWMRDNQNNTSSNSEDITNDEPVIKKKSNDKKQNSNVISVVTHDEKLDQSIVKSQLIPRTKKYEGLINVTQFERGSTIWIAENGRQFERNDFGSFRLLDNANKNNIQPKLILLDDNYSIHSDEEKTKENIVKYFQYVLDDSYSDEFINVISDYGNHDVHWKHFCVTNTKPLSFSHMMNSVVLPFKRGGNDVYSISDDRTTWIDKEGIQYAKNTYDSFKRLTPISSAKKCDLPENVMTRNHCDFDKIIQYEKKRAESNLKLLDKKLFSPSFEEIDNIFAYDFPEVDHRTQFLIDKEILEFVRGVENGKD